MTEPIERVARALWTSVAAQDEPQPKAGWEEFISQARAIIYALREPTEIMIEAGSEFIKADAVELSDAAGRDDAANIWRAMIDTALVG
jgi:hypothetical protein